MPISILFGGSLVPILLMLSPLAVMAVSDCIEGASAIDATKAGQKAVGERPCGPPPLPLM